MHLLEGCRNQALGSMSTTEIKLFGGLLVLLAGVLSAGAYARFEKKRLSVLDAWMELLLYIRGQIDCYLMPIDRILGLADRDLLRACSGGKPVSSLTDTLHGALPYLDFESRRLLSSLARELGSSYREEQLKRCDYYLQALQRQREKLEQALPNRIKLGTTVRLCVAIGTAILLW